MENKNKNNPKFKKNPFFSFLIFSVIATILLNFFMPDLTAPQEEEIRYDEFMNWIAEDKVEEVKFNNDKIIITPKKEKEDDNKQSSLLPIMGMNNEKVRN